MNLTQSALVGAVKLVCPGRPFVCDPETYDGLRMLDDGPKPSLEDLAAAWEARTLPVPASVTAYQLQTWLAERDLYAGVTEAINGIPDAKDRLKAQIAWRAAAIYERTHPLVGAMAMALGMDSAAVDQAFREAAEL